MSTIKTNHLVNVRRQKVVIEHKSAGEWWIMHDDGRIEEWDTAEHALKSAKRAAKKRNLSVTVTEIEWRNVPDGWKPPQ